MDLQTLKKLFPNASESTIRANVGPVAGLQGAVAEPNQRRESQDQRVEESACRVVVSILSLRRKLLDSDNHVGGAKPLRDAIADTCFCDDADPRLRWEYHQLKTDGPQGTIVLITVQ